MPAPAFVVRPQKGSLDAASSLPGTRDVTKGSPTMDVFQVHQQLLADYEAFTAGFTKIHDDRIREHVDRRVANGDQWPDAYLSLNPNFASGGSISELVKQGFLHPECEQIFRVGKEEPPGSPGQVIDLHRHQREAIEIARGGASYMLTTGTGSGKSLSYIVPIVDSVLRQPPQC